MKRAPRHLLRLFLTGVIAALPLSAWVAIFGWAASVLYRWLGPDSAVGSLLIAIGLGVTGSELVGYLIGIGRAGADRARAGRRRVAIRARKLGDPSRAKRGSGDQPLRVDGGDGAAALASGRASRSAERAVSAAGRQSFESASL